MKSKLLSLVFVLGLLPFSAAAMDVHISEAPVRTVLEGLARSSSTDIILDDSVQGNVTVHLSNVTARQALRLVAESRNLVFVENGNVCTVTAGGGDGRAVHTLDIANAAPDEVASAVKAVVPDAKVEAVPSTNQVILGGTWQETAMVRSLVNQLDVLPQQVDVEVEVASIDRDSLKKHGIEWDWSAVEGGADHNPFFYQAQVHALEENGTAHILARPHMVATNGKEASIFIGDRVPVQTESVASGEKTTTTTYEEAGIRLRYTPRVHSDGSITAQVAAEVSTPIFVPELRAYRIATRRASSLVRMEAGRPLVIGGLIRREEIEHLRKVPLLGDIPLLGRLFRSHYRSKKDTEVVLILSATSLERAKPTALRAPPLKGRHWEI